MKTYHDLYWLTNSHVGSSLQIGVPVQSILPMYPNMFQGTRSRTG